MHFFHYLLLFGSAVLAGALNSVSGGGSFISFPALILVGVPPISANATNTAALWPGLVVSAKVFRQDITIERQTLLMLAAVSLLGAVLGSVILLHTTPTLFEQLIPYLLLLATLLFTFSEPLKVWFQKRKQTNLLRKIQIPLASILFLQLLVAIYGGFFGGGIGILLLAILSLMGLSNMNAMLFHRTLLSVFINGVSLVPLIMANVIAWHEAMLMSVGALVGGYWAADYARRLNPLLIRRFVTCVGVSLTIYFFLKGVNPQIFLTIGVVAFIIATMVWLYFNFRFNRFSRNNNCNSPTPPLADKTISRTEWVDPLRPKQKTTSILLLLLVVQSLTLLWTYQEAITKMFADTAFSIAQHFPQSKSKDCIAPSTATADHSTYLQVCNAMQDILNVPNGQFFYGGTMGAAALRSKSFLNEIQIAHPDFLLRYHDPLSVPPDSTTGIKMLLDGELSFAESQRPLRDQEYQQAKDRGFALKQIPVAMTGAAFYIHRDLHLPGLSIDQLQAIYLGEITNWVEVGGPDLPIIPVSQDKDWAGSTLGLLLQQLPSNNQPLAEQIHRVRDTTAALRTVAKTPGAIGFGTQAIVAQQQSVRLLGLAKAGARNYVQSISTTGEINKAALQDGTYPLIQRIFVVIRQDGTLDEMAGFAYANLLLSEKGQTLINQAGYLPLRIKSIENPALP